jgi:hypothetical protein
MRPVVAGHSASKTRVNALMYGDPIIGLGAR